MSRNNTGNPIDSKAFPDFEDNVKNLDLAVNSDELRWSDRFGRDRKSFEGMEREFDSAQEYRENEFESAQNSREVRFNDFISASGYQFLGDYAAGIEFTEYNQLVRDENGEFWRLSGQVELPYTTTGAGIPEDDSLVPAGDAVLRQDLSNPDKGAAIVARGVVAVDSIADLLALPEGQRKAGLRYLVRGYHADTDIGGGEFIYDPTRTGENDGGTVLDGFVRLISGGVRTSWFGARDGLDDQQAPFALALAAAGALGAKLTNDVACYVSGGLVCRVDMECERPIITDHASSESLLRIEYDSSVDLTGQVGDLGGFAKGSTKIVGLVGHMGATLRILSDEDDINRVSHSTTYKKRSTHVVTSDDGTITPELPHDYDPAQITSLVLYGSAPMEVGVWVEVVGDASGPISRTIVRSNRSFLTIRKLRIENKTDNYVPILQGLSIDGSCKVAVHNPILDGFHYPEFGYPIAIYNSSMVDVYNPWITRSRKSIDGTYNSHVTVHGGYCEAPMGTHWGRHWSFRGTTVTTGAGVAPGMSSQYAFFGSGGDFSLHGCKAIIRGVVNPRLFAARSDVLDIEGQLTVDDCTLVADGSGSAHLVFLAALNGADYGRDITLPDSLTITNSRIYSALPTISLRVGLGASNSVVNSVTLPRLLTVDGRLSVDTRGVQGTASVSADNGWRVNNSDGNIQLVSNDDLSINLMMRGLRNGGILLSGRAIARCLVEDSVIDRVWHAGGSSDANPKRRISFRNSTITPVSGEWGLQCWYEFVQCTFNGLIEWGAGTYPELRVIFTSGNQGEDQEPNFALDGAYRLQS